MTTPAEKATDYAVESLKLIMTLASGSLVLTITFLKDIVGTSDPTGFWLVVVGWIFLLLSIIFSWLALVSAASKIAENNQMVYVFSSEKPPDPPPVVPAANDTGTAPAPSPNQSKAGQPFKTVASWFIPLIATRELNSTRKLAASGQAYFFTGLFLIGLFAAMNFQSGTESNNKKGTPPDSLDTETVEDSLKKVVPPADPFQPPIQNTAPPDSPPEIDTSLSLDPRLEK